MHMHLTLTITYSKYTNKCPIFCNTLSVSSNDKVESLEENLYSRSYILFYLMTERSDCYR